MGSKPTHASFSLSKVQFRMRSNDNSGVVVKSTCFSFKWSILFQKSKLQLKIGFVQMSHILLVTIYINMLYICMPKYDISHVIIYCVLTVN